MATRAGLMFQIPSFLFLVALLFPTVVSHSAPLVIVPGLGGSVLEAKLHNRPIALDCQRDSDWYTIWASVVQGVARYSCFCDNLRLYENKSSFTGLSNYTGVQIRPRDYGGTKGVEYSNAGTGEPPIAYMHAMIASLKLHGYVPGVSVRAATNDFRIVGVPAALDYEYAKLKGLIEDTYKLNDGSKVHLLSHSLGGPLANLFLTTFVNSAWKSKFIASHIMLSAPLLGTPVAIYAAISGPRYDNVPQFLPQLIVPLVRSFPSIAWMWPRVSAKGVNVWSDINFIETPDKNYSLTSLKQLAGDVKGASILFNMMDMIAKRTLHATSDPNVKVLCMYANDTKTDLSIKTNSKFNDKGTTTASTWGDGTVSLLSLEACKSWRNVEVLPIKFGGTLAAHTEIVQNKQVIAKVIDWLQSN